MSASCCAMTSASCLGTCWRGKTRIDTGLLPPPPSRLHSTPHSYYFLVLLLNVLVLPLLPR